MLDVDGTLAPIARTPQAAVVPPATRETLDKLVRLPRVSVALVSGRSAEDALRLVSIKGVWILGNHGLEMREPNGVVITNAAAQDHAQSIDEAARQLADVERSTPGALVENKRLTLSVHYRLVRPAEASAVVARAREVASRLGLRVTEGKKIVELRPPVDVNKGTAAVAFAERVGAIGERGSTLYAGDDLTDEDAFDALRTSSQGAVTIRILAHDEDEAPVQTRAEFALRTPEELSRVLDWLVARRARGGRA